MLDDAVPVLFQCGSNLCRAFTQYFAPHHNHHIAWRQAVLIPAKAFPKQSFQAIPCNRCRNLFSSYRKPEARAVTGFLPD